jgi:hypothetical protein
LRMDIRRSSCRGGNGGRAKGGREREYVCMCVESLVSAGVNSLFCVESTSTTTTTNQTTLCIFLISLHHSHSPAY